MIGETIAHYRVIEKLGSGGMGDVFRAEDTDLKRFVALKVLPRELTLDETARQRFKHEAQAASALDHPNVGTIYQILESDGRSVIAMACYEGGTLRDRIAGGPLPLEETLDIVRQIARGLGKAHARDIVHRDVKPANIMFADDSHVKIVDFGLAKLAGQTVLTQTGTTLGTIAYMSPEQARGEAVDHRADLWSLGIILYEMLVGRRPFAGDYDQAVVYSILNVDPGPVSSLRPDMPRVLDRIVEKALEKSPDRRYQSAEELLADLELAGGDGTTVGTIATARQLSRRQKARLLRVTAVAALAVVLGVLVLWRMDRLDAMPVSIAVLPLVSDAHNGDIEWFSNGMTDALITDLAQIANLRVISRNSIMRYRGVDKSVGQIARELNVRYVVDGSVNKSGNSVRISTRLVDPADERYIWADRYEADFTDVLDTQSRIAESIAREIHGTLSPSDETRLARSRKINPRVYEAYLRGMNHINKFTREEVARGLQYLHEAVELDPADARAWAGLAYGYITVGHSPAPTPDVFQRARAAAERAVRLDSTLAEARSALAVVKDYYEWDWEAAEREYQRANALNPSLAMNRYHYAWYLVLFDRMDEAVEEHETALDLNPLDPPMTAWMGDIYRMVGEFDKAEAQVRKSLELGDKTGISHLVRGWTLLEQGRNEEAVASHEDMVVANPLWKGILGATYAAVGRTDDALRIAREIESSEVNSMGAFQLAALYAELGEADKAFEWADFEPHHAFVPWLATKWAPFWSLRDDPRFDKFRRRLNLEPVRPIAWRQAGEYSQWVF